MNIGIACTSVNSFKYLDGLHNITGDSIEADCLARYINHYTDRTAEVIGMNDQRRLLFLPKNKVDLTIHLNLSPEEGPILEAMADKNILYFQNAYPNFESLFPMINKLYNGVMFHSRVIHESYMELSGKLPS